MNMILVSNYMKSNRKLYSVVEPLPFGEHGIIAYKSTSHPNNIKEKLKAL